MYGRIDKHFVITTNNLKALEAVSEWIYQKLKTTYLIQIEMFPNMTVYRIAIPIREDWDNKVKQDVENYLECRHLKLMEETE